jgi:hypothetical protein
MAGIPKKEGGTVDGEMVSRLTGRERSQFFEMLLAPGGGGSTKSGQGQ